MIDLVLQIRRAAPEGYRPEIKFSNPELLNALKSMSDEVGSSTLKSAVERLLTLADADSMQRYEAPSIVANAKDASGLSLASTRIYRGQRVAG